MLNRLANVALAAVLAHGFDTDARSFWDLSFAQLSVGRDHHVVEVSTQLLANGIVGFPLDPHVDVFGVLPVNDHV